MPCPQGVIAKLVIINKSPLGDLGVKYEKRVLLRHPLGRSRLAGEMSGWTERNEKMRDYRLTPFACDPFEEILADQIGPYSFHS